MLLNLSSCSFLDMVPAGERIENSLWQAVNLAKIAPDLYELIGVRLEQSEISICFPL